MTDEMPPGGWPLRMAITALALDRWADSIRGYREAEMHEPAISAQNLRNFLWLELIFRAHRGEVVFRGVKPDADEPSTIDPGLLSGSSKPDYAGDSLTTAGRTYHSVTVFLFERAPRHHPIPVTSAVIEKGAGGRTPVYDWISFTKEVVRFANLDGFGKRSELAAHMRGWCTKTWSVQPDDRTFARKIKEICPDDIPA